MKTIYISYKTVFFTFFLLFVIGQKSFSNNGTIENAGSLSQAFIYGYPSSISSCSTQAVTFIVSSDLNLPPSTLSYLWSVGPGWNVSGSIYTTSNNLILTPSSPTSSLSAVSCTMIYSNNNGNQSWFGTDNFYVTRKPYTSKAIISGSRTLCTGNSTYNLTNLLPDETVTWSLSNPSVCDIVSSTNSQIVLSPTSELGDTLLIATITNSCNQSVQKNISIHNGAPTLLAFNCGSLGRDFCSGNSIEIESNTMPILDLNDKVTAIFSGMTTSEANLNANWQWQTVNGLINLNGSLGQRRIGLFNYGVTGLKVKAKNACGWSDWYQLDFELVEVPPIFERNASSVSFSVAPNPSNDLIKIKVSEDIQLIDRNGIQADLYNMLNIVKSSVKFDNGEAVIDVKGLEKGTYVLKIRYNEKEEVHQVIVN